MSLSDQELIAKAEANFAALSKPDQDKVVALFARRDREEQLEFDKAYDTWFRCVLDHKDPPFEACTIVVRGLDLGMEWSGLD